MRNLSLLVLFVSLNTLFSKIESQSLNEGFEGLNQQQTMPSAKSMTVGTTEPMFRQAQLKGEPLPPTCLSSNEQTRHQSNDVDTQPATRPVKISHLHTPVEKGERSVPGRDFGISQSPGSTKEKESLKHNDMVLFSSPEKMPTATDLVSAEMSATFQAIQLHENQNDASQTPPPPTSSPPHDLTDDQEIVHEEVATNQNDFLGTETGLSDEPRSSDDPKSTASGSEKVIFKDDLSPVACYILHCLLHFFPHTSFCPQFSPLIFPSPLLHVFNSLS